MEGTTGFKVGVIRGRSCANLPLRVFIETFDITALDSIHYVLQTDQVVLTPGERFASVLVDLPQVHA